MHGWTSIITTFRTGTSPVYAFKFMPISFMITSSGSLHYNISSHVNIVNISYTIREYVLAYSLRQAAR